MAVISDFLDLPTLRTIKLGATSFGSSSIIFESNVPC